MRNTFCMIFSKVSPSKNSTSCTRGFVARIYMTMQSSLAGLFFTFENAYFIYIENEWRWLDLGELYYLFVPFADCQKFHMAQL